MKRLETVTGYFFACLGFVLAGVSILVVPADAFGDYTKGTCSDCQTASDPSACSIACCGSACSGDDGTCAGDCCTDACGMDATCQANCSATVYPLCLKNVTKENCEPNPRLKCGLVGARICTWGDFGPCLCLGF
ncbi:MAG: hypothetical protein HYX68_09455 [Planctomycetes bacterium]|nr:hypothetical protein [Planctomycetota bacterium]